MLSCRSTECTLMKLEESLRASLTFDGGLLHVPFTLYLNDRYDNPHTIASAARGLRVLARFVDAFDIDVLARALEGRCLGEVEKKALCQLAFHPIDQIEMMSARSVRSIASAQRGARSQPIGPRVAPNTARKHLELIADFLLWYHDKVLEPRMPLTSVVTDTLRRAYSSCAAELKHAVAGTRAAHAHRIKSVPTERFLEIYSTVFLNPQMVFETHGAKRGSTVMRDRAMVMTAAEGIRPGALGNLALADFRWSGGMARGHLLLRDNTPRRLARPTTSTPTQKGARSRQNYNSELTISIWPTTAQAIHDYINSEREIITGRTLRNLSKGFLYLATHGGPIRNRSTIATVFRRAGIGLGKLGLLERHRSDPYLEGDSYSFTAYLLRHSAASLFYASKTNQAPEVVAEDLMKMRFGWAQESSMPRLYAQRAMSDAASLTVEEFVESLIKEARTARKKSQGGTT